MSVTKYLVTAVSLISVGAFANPAPVADLSRSSNKTFNVQTNARSGSVEERLASLERVVEARAAAQLNLQQQLATLLDEVSELRGTTEMHNHKLEEILQQQRDIYQEIDRRMSGQSTSTPSMQPQVSAEAEVSSPVPVGNPAAIISGAPSVTPQPIATRNNPTMTEAQAYEQAINFVIKENNYAAAIPAFESFLKNYPNSDYASNAHYWLGQLYYNKNDFANSKTHFERIVNQYPNAARVPEALEKLGLVAEKQNDKTAAKRYYNQLVKGFPSSKPAAKARKKLETL